MRLVLFSIAFITMAFSSHAFAASRMNYGFSLGVATGQMGNATNAPQRTMLFIPTQVYVSLRFGSFSIGPHLDYFQANQSTAPEQVQGQNLTGVGSAFGVRIALVRPVWSLAATYRLSTAFNLERQTGSGATTNYTGNSGYGAYLLRQTNKNWGFYFEYVSETYKDSLSDPITFTRYGLGLLYSNWDSIK